MSNLMDRRQSWASDQSMHRLNRTSSTESDPSSPFVTNPLINQLDNSILEIDEDNNSVIHHSSAKDNSILDDFSDIDGDVNDEGHNTVYETDSRDNSQTNRRRSSNETEFKVSSAIFGQYHINKPTFGAQYPITPRKDTSFQKMSFAPYGFTSLPNTEKKAVLTESSSLNKISPTPKFTPTAFSSPGIELKDYNMNGMKSDAKGNDVEKPNPSFGRPAMQSTSSINSVRSLEGAPNYTQSSVSVNSASIGKRTRASNTPNFNTPSKPTNTSSSQIFTPKHSSPMVTGSSSPLQSPTKTVEEDIGSIDASIASLKQSMNNFRHKMEDDKHNTTMETAKFDDTRVQMESDLSFSNFKKPVKHAERKSHAPSASVSSWRKFRPSSAYFEETPNLQSIAPSSGLQSAPKSTFSAQDSNTLSKIDELNKQITGYRIQIKFFKQFLHDLISKTRKGDNNIDLSELANWKENLEGSPPKNSEYSKLEEDYKGLLQSYEEVFKLNEDLYTNLEDFQSQLQGKEEQLHKMHEYIESCCDIVDDILHTLINNQNTDEPTKKALARCLEPTKSGHRSLEMKVQVVSFEFNKLINSTSPRLSKLQPKTAQQHYDNTQVLGLISSLGQLEQEFNIQKEETLRVEELLREEVKQANVMRERYSHISRKFKELCESLEAKQGHSHAQMEALKAENERLQNINAAVNVKFEEYHAVINHLQQEVNEFKDFSRNKDASFLSDSTRKTDTDTEIAALTQKYEQLKIESQDTIASLKEQVAKYEKDLKSVDQLTKEKDALSSTVKSLENMTSTGIEFKELLQVDVYEFQKMLKSFNKIADDASVKDPTRKIDNLSKRLYKLESGDTVEISLLRDLHKSIFSYFVRAVEIIVNDHVKLLLKENESSNQTNEYVEKLHNRVDELNSVNDSLLKQLESLEANETQPEPEASPRTKLRMTELWNRWKSEREARVYESKQADRRLRELETENARLREQLAKHS